MNYDYIKFFQDYRIPYDPDSAISRGFIAIPCPYCIQDSHKNKGYYGAVHSEKNYYICWKCGKLPLPEVFFMLSGENWNAISTNYKTNLDIRETYLLKHTEDTSPTLPRTLRLPPAWLCNLDRGKAYLKSRGFVPEAIIQEYGLVITGPIGDYKFRIIIPIYQHGKLVSYQGRDYTGLSPIRYKACARENEIVHHKHLLYDADRVTGDHVIVVEGILDKWKMGENTVCTFGTGFTQQQVNLLSKWVKVSILYDGEPEAQKHAEKLGEQLSGLGTNVENIRLGKEDPGALSMEEAQALSKEILGG